MKLQSSTIYHQSPLSDAQGKLISIPVWTIHPEAPLSRQILLLAARRHYLELPLPIGQRLNSAMRHMESATRRPSEASLRKILRYLQLDPLILPLFLSGTAFEPVFVSGINPNTDHYRILNHERNVELMSAPEWHRAELKAKSHLKDLLIAKRISKRVKKATRAVKPIVD